ncbi:endonuclease/exonuclease/phosphatase family protein [Ligilactobacillus apodemi]|uniref:Endonuclease/exonuclease/phosphatase domain-containing protein n=1 Tax=Ligilactobacillus apodemi DSM 16634 = JCM 16172 TaxID=1423724 RepID=A0A0R1U5F0_9LACO|nr:endonuclease/exonuclease/phosphatase family protein [Ligilactobacillus apodemi]KRL86226.1 hypothetical protein FC32_GL001939 [Ligilactobacillus apodemi DSM 16634 = JCM 16172]MCR1902053.1 endonuclease/exonuclease/phosphatase family protein [Ligilactobacillus apodemi]
MAKFLTLNTHSWLGEDPQKNLKILGQKIIKEDYDVIALQEINQLKDSPATTNNYYDLKNQHQLHEDNYGLKLVEYLQQQGVNYYFVWTYNHIGYDKYHEGVALLSKQPFTATKSVLTSSMDDEFDYHTRRALLGKTTVSGQEIWTISSHFSWWKDGFKDEWARLENSLQGETLPLVIMGDFNNPENTPGHDLIINSPLGLKDSYLAAKEVIGGPTIQKDIDGWEGNEQALRIDFIFVSEQFEVSKNQVVFDGKNEALISDHFGVECLVK